MKKLNAFTLIELLIVVAIIGILAAIAVPNFMNAQIRAKIARTLSDIKAQATSLEQYRLDNNSYPQSAPPGTPPRLWRLSTPVAYMSSVPHDVFGDPLVAYGGYYHYVERKSEEAWFRADWHSSNSDLQTAGSMTLDVPGGLYWHIRSVGPNKALDYGFPYSSSNGLVTVGDIDVFGP